MIKVSFPSISKSHFQGADDTWAYLNVILEAYQKALVEKPEMQESMSIDQHALMAYAAFHTHVSVGGFIQLIQNGFGSYMFENPFSEIFGEWGATKTMAIMDKARPIYNEKSEELERETSLEEFTKMYQEIPDFDTLDQEYLKVMEEEAIKIRSYVEGALSLFVSIQD